MNEKRLIFCGNNPKFLNSELVKNSNFSNGGTAFRIPSITNSNGTLVAVADRQSCGDNWGYIELAVRYSENGGETWSDIKSIAAPPARETRSDAKSFASSFFINPCMAVAENGDIILIANFYPESKGIHNEDLIDKKKAPYTSVNGRFLPVVYDREGNFFSIHEDGSIYDKTNSKTDYKVKGIGELYRKDEYFGNIYLNGALGKNELGVKTTFGAPLKAPKRSYVFMLKSCDGGKTWSTPVDITHMILDSEDGTFLNVASGAGITMPGGRIIMPLYTKKNSFSIYTVDNGETWHRMRTQKYNGVIGEWAPVVSNDYSVFAIGTPKKYGKAPFSVSRNEGKNWIKLSPSKINICPCQKGLLAVGDYVFCSHPSGKSRENGVISVGKFTYKNNRASEIKWLKEIKINEGYFAYSSLVKINDDTIGVIYESQPSSYIEFEKFSINNLI